MNLQKHLKKSLAVLITGALVVSIMLPAFAELNGDINADQEQTQGYTYSAPTEPMEVDENIITASAHRAASPILGMMGVNATSGFGMINGSAPSDLASAQNCAALGIWGSSLNENPDPYYWNYFYNFYAEETEGAEPVASSVDGGTALTNGNWAGSPVIADTTLFEEYGNISGSIATRPDILVGCASSNSGDDVSGYDSQLETIHSFTPDSEYYHEGDETYSPELVSYQTTYIKQMIESVKRLANAITQVEEETGKTTRYGDVQVIANDYEKYVYGVIAYVQEELAAKGLEEKTVAVLTAINEDGTYTIADSLATSATSLVRGYEYAMCVSKSLVDEVGSTTVTLEELLSADVIITINNQNITKTDLEQSFGTETYNGILITNTPATLYGMTMNSVENAMGYAYIIGSMYSDVLNIDPVELCAYFYQHFWHVTDLDSLATVVKTNFSETILPDGVTGTLSANYSAATVEAKLAKGIAYYQANEAAFDTDEYTLIGMSEWAPDTASGIGSGSASTVFTDVSETAWYADAVTWAYNAGVTAGTSDTTFSPNMTCNRAQIVTFLWNAAGQPAPASSGNPFTDVSETEWYYDAVLWAVENGITAGTSATTFSPNTNCDRAQIVTFLWNAAGQPAPADGENPFTDVSETEWYYDAVLWAVENGVTAGTSATTFSPSTICDRAQAVTFLYNDLT